MTKTRCKTCVGSGKVMGGGMLLSDCDDCDGVGKIYTKEPVEIVTSSPRYQEALDKIKALDKNITDEEAKDIFNKELERIKDEPNGQDDRAKPKEHRKKHSQD